MQTTLYSGWPPVRPLALVRCSTLLVTVLPAKEISVFDYSQVVFAALLGYLFLGQLADDLSYLGYLIIIATAVAKWIYTMKKE